MDECEAELVLPAGGDNERQDAGRLNGRQAGFAFLELPESSGLEVEMRADIVSMPWSVAVDDLLRAVGGQTQHGIDQQR